MLGGTAVSGHSGAVTLALLNVPRGRSTVLRPAAPQCPYLPTAGMLEDLNLGGKAVWSGYTLNGTGAKLLKIILPWIGIPLRQLTSALNHLESVNVKPIQGLKALEAA